jgi:hypothetical protein
MQVRGFASGVALGGAATWLVVGALGAGGTVGDQGSAAQVPNGDPCAGQELTLKIDGRRSAPAIRYGPADITGVLHCGSVPIRDAQVTIASVGCLPSGVQPIAGAVTTGLDGSFAYVVPPGPNRTLSFAYTSYSDDPGPSVTTTATLRVRPRLALRIEPRTVRNKHTIYWTVTALGGPFPQAGVTLDPQVKEGKRWQTFDQFRVPREGTSRIYAYTFLRTSKPTAYAFRVALPETGSGEYPYVFAASNVVRVRVNP